MGEVVFQCAVDDVPPPPRGLRFDVGSGAKPTAGFLVRRGDEFRAYRNRCAHLWLELDFNPGLFYDVDNRFLQCSTHAALFDPLDGRCVAGPCAGRYLESLPIRISAGTITVFPPGSAGRPAHFEYTVDTTT